MASEDVIELGSSDDDTEPVTKKPKPMLNAMVCIPNKFREVTIKPAKGHPTLVPKGLSKAVTVTKFTNMCANPFANKAKLNGKAVIKGVIKQDLKVKPFVRIQNQNKIKSNVTVKNINTMNNKTIIPIKGLKIPTKIQNPINLPPSITVKRTIAPKCMQILPNVKGVVNLAHITRKQKLMVKPVGEVLTVELDDDESSPSTSSPQWYLRPEDEAGKTEEINNAEPEPTNMIEITIEDSPVKPILNKRTCEVGTELAITIDDSPIKPAAEKRKHNNSSDSEDKDEDISKVPHSKKKLKYPKEVDNEPKTIEIEVEPLESFHKNSSVVEASETVAMDEAFQDVQVAQTSTPKKNNMLNSQEPKDVDVIVVGDGEFHPVYQKFIDLCFQLENSEDMKKIVEKKIRGYHRQVPKEYTESEEFIDMVSSKILAMRAGPEKMYLYIKDIVDELNLQRKLAKAQVGNKQDKSAEPEQYAEDSEFDTRRRRQIRKLEKTIKKLHRAIQKLEEQEVDFDDDDDSVYLLTERYKERMVRVYAKFCQLTNTKMPSEPRIQIDARPGQPTGPAKRLEKWINKKVPIGTPLPFPDFHDVLRCVRDANDEDKLGWNEVDIMEEARDLFTRCGKKLQRRRQENEWRLAASRLALDVDPAENNVDLQKRLDDNRQLATKKEIEIFNKFADRQYQLKLEAVEIGDKEAEESPVESEDEDANEAESVSLENKAKRKERLKRLLEEKSKKDKGEEKENQATKELEKPEIPIEISETVDKEDTVPEAETDPKLREEETEQKDTRTPQNSVEKSPEHVQEAHCISDDSNKVESDIDELHLLQKLHSGNEAESSTLESSDSESPIAISDTLESSGDNKPKRSSDVISIENSSYSEAEVDQEMTDNNVNLNKSVEKLIRSNVEIEYSNMGVEKVQNRTNNAEYNESVEDILLASSDDEDEAMNKEGSTNDDDSINTNDDLISIDETVVDDLRKDNNANDNLISIHETVIDIVRKETADINSTETVEVNEVMDVDSIEEYTNNNVVDYNDVVETSLVEESINNIEESTVKAASENDINTIEIVNDIETVCIKSVESLDTSQDEVLKEDDSAAANIETVSNDAGFTKNTEIMEVDEGEEKVEKLLKGMGLEVDPVKTPATEL